MKNKIEAINKDYCCKLQQCHDPRLGFCFDSAFSRLSAPAHTHTRPRSHTLTWPLSPGVCFCLQTYITWPCPSCQSHTQTCPCCSASCIYFSDPLTCCQTVFRASSATSSCFSWTLPFPVLLVRWFSHWVLCLWFIQSFFSLLMFKPPSSFYSLVIVLFSPCSVFFLVCIVSAAFGFGLIRLKTSLITFLSCFWVTSAVVKEY